MWSSLFDIEISSNIISLDLEKLYHFKNKKYIYEEQYHYLLKYIVRQFAFAIIYQHYQTIILKKLKQNSEILEKLQSLKAVGSDFMSNFMYDVKRWFCYL